MINKICKYHFECTVNDGTNKSTEYFPNLNSTFWSLDMIPLDKAVKFDFSNLITTETKLKKVNYKIGYPNLIKLERNKNGRFIKKIQPIFLFSLDPIDLRGDELMIKDNFPEFNHDFIKSISQADSDEGLSIAKEIYNELNINSSIDNNGLNDLIEKLIFSYPNWNWKGSFDSNSTTYDTIEDINETGIYNYVFLFETEPSKYSKGLESELLLLSEMDTNCFKDTQLQLWTLADDKTIDSQDSEIKIIEPISINDEQREAVKSSLTNSLTIVTGPPGTGKSQVVTNIIINAAYNGQTVLLSSKNHKAVDIVIDKVNSLSDSEFLVKLSDIKDTNSLLNYLSSLSFKNKLDTFSEAYNQEAQRLVDIEKAITATNARIRETIEYRNEASYLEEEIEQFSKKYPRIIAKFIINREADNIKYKENVDNIVASIINHNIFEYRFFKKIYHILLKKKSFEKFLYRINEMNRVIIELGIEPNCITFNEFNKDKLSIITKNIIQFQREFNKAIEYANLLKKLRIRDISNDIEINYKLRKLKIQTSKKLWSLWVKHQASSVLPKYKREIGDFIAILNMIKNGRSDISKDIWRKYYRLLPIVLRLIPCCSITLLSAKNKIPFEPKLFDLIVIDEASQCDIASLIPILYRAKRAVIIGDPKQLSHITSISNQFNEMMLKRNNLFDNYLEWSYLNSAFQLSSLIHHGRPFKLIEHYRSHPEIINFANNQSYNKKLIILTNDQLDFSKRRVFFEDITGTTKKDNTGSYHNINEAKKTLQLLKRIVKKDIKFTVGVVTPFRGQANLIRRMVNEDVELSNDLSKRSFICDTVHKFQGDERDVVIYNSVISENRTDSMIWFLTNSPELFNVAITRARSYYIFVGDKQVCLDSKIPYYKNYIEYVKNLIDAGPNYPPGGVNPPLPFESIWEEILYHHLIEEGYRPLIQYSIINYRLDFALFVGDRKINIEVDGEMYHKNWTGARLKQDLIRDRRLIDLEWEVLRFWVYELKYDMNGCLERIKKTVESKQTNFIF